MSLFYDPKEHVAADFVPFQYEGKYHLFYLTAPTDEQADQSPTWHHVVTEDFLVFTEQENVVHAPSVPEKNMYIFTGSVIEHHGTFHMFYTEYSPRTDEEEMPKNQVVHHAVSADLDNWQADENFALEAGPGYAKDTWRAPFVFLNPETNEFNMLLAARQKDGASGHRGCIALATSSDLESWHVQQPFWAPNMFITHESPNLFQLGDWWYLVYTTYGREQVVHYRMSRTLQGPWRVPDKGALNAGAFYSAKTAGSGDKRYCFGWLPCKKGGRDSGAWQWGGSLVVSELNQQKNGQLALTLPATMEAHFSRDVQLRPKALLGDWEIEQGNTAYTAAYERFSALLLGRLPEECLLDLDLQISEQTTEAGVLLRANEKLDWYYQLHVDRLNQRLRLERWPRPGGMPFTIERQFTIRPNQPIKLQLVVDGSRLIVFADDTVMLCGRMYEHKSGNLALYVTEGSATFNTFRLRTP
ncbi:MAG: GH32 C-terminal domain-containing protein [Verrucomicrobiota bacterium]